MSSVNIKVISLTDARKNGCCKNNVLFASCDADSLHHQHLDHVESCVYKSDMKMNSFSFTGSILFNSDLNEPLFHSNLFTNEKTIKRLNIGANPLHVQQKECVGVILFF